MRTIKFRGKIKGDNEWVYGYYSVIKNFITEKDLHKITDVDGFIDEIDEDTLGQFTGLYDKNGREVFEGDVIQVLKDNDNGIFEIKWIDFATAFGIIEKGDDIERSRLIQKEVMLESVIIGNIYDNPELLER